MAFVKAFGRAIASVDRRAWLEQAGVKVIRVKGQRVRALRRYLSEHAKTDSADAYVLGAIPLFSGVPTDPVYVPDAERHALQRLTRQRERLEESRLAGLS